MKDINPQKLQQYIDTLVEQGYDTDTIHKKLSSVEKFLHWAAKKGKINKNLFEQLQSSLASINETLINKESLRSSNTKLYPVPSIEPQIQDFKTAEYQGEKKTDGLAAEFYFKFNIRSYKIKSFLKGIYERLPLLSDKNQAGNAKEENTELTNGSRFTLDALRVQHYIAAFLLLVLIAGLGAGMYVRFFQKANSTLAYPTSLTGPGTTGSSKRFLSFQARLTDNLGNPIITATNLQFRLYTAKTGGSTLYDTSTCSITPDEDGIFDVLIGGADESPAPDQSTCGNGIPATVFSENAQVFLGVKVASDAEMTPRQQIANVAYAMNAETLQGFPPGTAAANIAYINSAGTLVAGPSVTASGGSTSYTVKSTATLTGAINSAQTDLYAQYAVPTVNLSGGTSNTLTNAYGSYVGLTASAGTVTNSYGVYIAAPTGAGTVTNKYAFVSASGAGNIGLGTTAPLNKLDVNGASVIGTSYAGTNTAPTNGLLVQGNVGIGTTTTNNKLDVNGSAAIGSYAGTGAPANSLIVSGNVGIGSTTPTAGFVLDTIGRGRFSTGLSVANTTTNFTVDVTGTGGFSTSVTSPIHYGGSAAGSTLALNGTSNGSPSNAYVLLNGSGQGNVGIGTTTPTRATLDVGGTIALTTLGSAGTTVLCQNGTSQIGTCSSITATSLPLNNIIAATADSGTVNHSAWAINWNWNTLSNQNAFTFGSNSGITSGKLLSIDSTEGNQSTLFTGALENINYSKTYTGTTGSETGNNLNISRALTLNNAGQTLTVSGAVANISDSATQTAGTLTHTADVLDVTQNYTSNTGTALYVKNYGGATSNSFRVDDVSGDTTPFIVDATGNVGIGTTSAGAALDVNGNLLVQGGGTIDTRAAGSLGIGTATQNALTIGRTSTAGTTLNGLSGSSSIAFGTFTVGTNGQISSSNAAANAINLTGNGAGITFTGASSNTNQIITSNNNHLALMPNGTGNVGIGSATPGTKLDINGTLRNNNTVTFTGIGSGSGTALCRDGSNNVVTCTSIATTTVPLNLITDAAGTATRAHANNAIVWNWDTLANETAFQYGSSSITGGKLLSVSSSSTGMTGTLFNVALSGNNSANTGTLIKTSVSGASSAAVPLMVTNLGTGNSFRVNDETGDTDSTPFIVDATGNVGIGTTTTGGKLDLQSTQTSGTLTKLGASGSVTLAGALTGLNLDLSSSYTNAAQSVTGQSIALGTTTAAFSVTTKALAISSGAFTTATGGSGTWTGIDLTMPNITQGAISTLVSTGLKITGGTVTSGTSYALTTSASAGNVGIGTTSPSSYNLQVSGTVGSTGIIYGAAFKDITSPSANIGLDPYDNGIAVDGGVGLAINYGAILAGTTGNVGIGTTSTNAKLTLDAGSTQAAMTINGTSNPEIILATSGSNRLEIATATAGGAYISGAAAGDSIFRKQTGGSILFSTSTSGATNDLTLAGGNVGIGKTTPSEKLNLADGANVLLDSGYLTTPFGGFGRYENLLTNSEALNSWTATNVSVTADAATAPDGQTAAESIQTTSSGGSVNQTSSTNSTGSFTFSVWLKSDSSRSVDIRIDGSGTGTASTVTVNNVWQRFSVSQSFGLTASNAKVNIFPGGTGGSCTSSCIIYAWGGQLEKQTTVGVYARTGSTTISTSRGFVADSAGQHLFTNGNVGIGTTATAYKMDILSQANTSGLRITDTSSGGMFIDSTSNQGHIMNGASLEGGTFTARNTEAAGIEWNAGYTKFFTNTGLTSGSSFTPSESMRISTGGNVSIGTTSGNYRTSIVHSISSADAAVAAITNNNSTDSTNTTGLRINLGVTSTTTNGRFVRFYGGVTSGDTGGTAVGNIAIKNNAVAYNTTGADFGEYIDVNEPTTVGDIIATTDSGQVRAIQGERLIGVVSDRTGFTGNAKTDNPLANQAIVGFLGQVETKVSTLNGSIHNGDPIAASSIKGVGAKAVDAGDIIGKAFEEFDPQNGKGTVIACPEGTSNGVICGRIMTYVNPSWYDPDIHLTSTGDVNIAEEPTNPIVRTNNGTLITKITAFAEATIGKISAGFIQTKQIASDTITSIQGDIESLRAKNITVAEKIISPMVETKDIAASGSAKLTHIETNEIKPQETDVVINLDITPTPSQSNSPGELAKVIIKGLEGKTIATIDSAGNATFSGTLASKSVVSDQLTVNQASISGNLVAKRVDAENINELEQQYQNVQQTVLNQAKKSDNFSSALNDLQQSLANIQNQSLPNAQYYQTIDDQPIASNSSQLNNLIAEQINITGYANMENAYVVNTLSVGNIMLNDNSVISMASDLRLTALNTVTFFDGSVVIAKDGTITSKGEIIAQKGIATNNIRPLNSSDDVDIALHTASSSATIANSKLKITDQYGNVNASIDASGSARFKDIALTNTYHEATRAGALIAASDNFTRYGNNSPALDAQTYMAGNGLIPANSSDVIIYNDKVTNDSLIYLTPSSSTANNSLTVVKKESCSGLINCRPYFKVAVANPTNSDVQFNWLIIN